LKKIRIYSISIIIFIGIPLCCTVSWVTAYLIYNAKQEAVNELRCYVFRDLLKPGMSRSEVREILSQFGDFRENESSFGEGHTEILIIFTDPGTSRRFGGNIILSFYDGKYARASIPMGSEAFPPACREDKQK